MEERIPELLQRHRAFWGREKVDRPLLTIMKYSPLAPKTLPLAGVTWGEEDLQLVPEMFDARRYTSVEQWHNVPGRLLMGDSFSVRQPFVRVPWVEAILGCPIWADRDSGRIWS
ncbi:MAG: hypothetical protein M0Z94_11380 [Dehalococcoidales bacterium]|nr:hypothetical protein [Dehalococcoidales bacterium]